MCSISKGVLRKVTDPLGIMPGKIQDKINDPLGLFPDDPKAEKPGEDKTKPVVYMHNPWTDGSGGGMSRGRNSLRVDRAPIGISMPPDLTKPNGAVNGSQPLIPTKPLQVSGGGSSTGLPRRGGLGIRQALLGAMNQ